MLNAHIAAETARAAAFVALVTANFSLIVVNRSFGASIVSTLLQPNRSFWVMLAATTALLAAALLIAPLRELFHFGPLTGVQLAASAGTGAAVMLLLALLKRLVPGSVLPVAQRGQQA
jgi:P-type Ca2+ transporter type 2C